MDSIDEPQAGDWRDIDQYVQELRETGYRADYENLWSGTNGFTAIVTVGSKEYAVFKGGLTGHLVKEVKTPIAEVTE